MTRIPFAIGVGSLAAFAPAQTFFGPGGPATTYYGGALFDVANTTSADLLLTGRFEIATNWDQDGVYRVYTKSGTYVGSENNLGAWTLLGETTTNGAGLGNLFTIDVSNQATLAANSTVGLAIFHVGGTGWSVGNGAIGYRSNGGTFSDANITVTTGYIKAYADPSNPFGTFGFTPRTFAGSVEYAAVPEPASLIAIGGALLALARRRRAR